MYQTYTFCLDDVAFEDIDERMSFVMKEGWKPLGSPTIFIDSNDGSTIFVQVMVK